METFERGTTSKQEVCHRGRVYCIDIGHTATQVSALVIIFFNNDFSNLRDKSCIKRKKKKV